MTMVDMIGLYIEERDPPAETAFEAWAKRSSDWQAKMTLEICHSSRRKADPTTMSVESG